jgi:hypothetical protein
MRATLAVTVGESFRSADSSGAFQRTRSHNRDTDWCGIRTHPLAVTTRMSAPATLNGAERKLGKDTPVPER